MASRFLLPLVMVVLLVVDALAAKSTDYRLPKGIISTSQTIELRLDPAESGYSGSVLIALQIDRALQRIELKVHERLFREAKREVRRKSRKSR